ncbi:MAG: sulfotransferase [Candidatus Marinimicrobia bacterium]|nr:sulfotransferase [Candidatus Neomarinimicrobiota bacterium]
MKSLSQNPIFVVGFPRSGTTLLQSVLATQTNLFSFPETHFFTSTIRLIKTGKSGFVLPGCLGSVISDMRLHTGHTLATQTIEKLNSQAKADTLSVKCIFETLVIELLNKQQGEEDLASIRWIEKTPGHIKHLETIQSFYPEAKFIEIIRNPLNAIYSFREKLPDSKLHTLPALAHQWKNSRELFKKYSAANPDRAYSTRYEDLLTKTNSSLAGMSDFLNIHIDVNKLNKLPLVARNIVLDQETWKTQNIEQGISEDIVDYQWKIGQRLQLGYLLQDDLRENEYQKRLNLLQYSYNICLESLNRLSRSIILAPFKKTVRTILEKTGLWPYSGSES